MSVCTKFNVNVNASKSSFILFYIFYFILFKTMNANLMVVLVQKSGDHQVSSIHPLGGMNVCTKDQSRG